MFKIGEKKEAYTYNLFFLKLKHCCSRIIIPQPKFKVISFL